MKEKLKKYGWIGVVTGGIGLGVSAIVAECRRHKTKKQLIDAEIALGLHKINNVIQKGHIRHLENELEKVKSESKEKES